MDAWIYRPHEGPPEDTGVRFCPRRADGIFKVWPLRRGVCEFCVKYTMRTRERRIAPSDDPSAEYRSFSRRKNVTSVPKVSTTITSTRKHVRPHCYYNHFIINHSCINEINNTSIQWNFMLTKEAINFNLFLQDISSVIHAIKKISLL